MTQHLLPLVVFLSCGLAPASLAEVLRTTLDTMVVDGETVSSVGFDYESCGGECYVAAMVCSYGSVALELADVDSESVAQAIVKETDQVVLSAGEVSLTYQIVELRYQEMTGTWWASTMVYETGAELLPAAIAGAEVVTAVIGNETVTLPVDDDVKAWATACQ